MYIIEFYLDKQIKTLILIFNFQMLVFYDNKIKVANKSN